MGWLTGWKYRKAIVIDQTDNLGADVAYQMKLLVGKSSSASGNNVHCGDLVAADFDDLRFTKSDGTALLDYWIESISGSGSSALATVWIETILLDAAADTTIYMYYSGTETAVSSGDNTFPFFDDFNDSSLDTAKWTNVGGAVEGAGTVVCTATSSALYGILGKTAFGQGYAMRARVKPTHYNTTSYLEGVEFGESAEATYLASYFAHIDSAKNLKHVNNNGSSNSYTTLAGGAAATWCIADIIRNGSTNAKFRINNANETTNTNYLSTNNYYVRVLCYGSNSVMECDWALIRKYTATEPIWSSFGSQETYISKINGVPFSTISKINGISLTSIAKISGISI